MPTIEQIADKHAGLPAHPQAFFMTPYDQYADREGQRVSIIEAITKADATHDAEVLPMFKVRFLDGVEIETWPEEIASGEVDVIEFVANATREAEANRSIQ